MGFCLAPCIHGDGPVYGTLTLRTQVDLAYVGRESEVTLTALLKYKIAV